MRSSLLLLLAALLASFLPSSLSQSTAQYQWGYLMRCAPNTLDYPCLIQVSGTATVNSTQAVSGSLSETINGTKTSFSAVPYFNIQSFSGQRNFTNRFGQSYVAPIQLTATASRATTTNLYLAAPYFNNQGLAFVGNATQQFYGGLFATEWYVSNNPYASETIVYQGAGNALQNDYTATVVCSTAPGFVAAAYNLVDDVPTASVNMNDCLAPSFATVAAPALPAAGTIQGFSLAYSITDNATFTVSVSATVYTDGTVNFDQLGNPYYNLIQMTGTRAYTYLPTGVTSTVAITSLMSQNIIASSNLAYITNNNRLYTQAPYIDRYGIAYTLASAVAVDGSQTGTQVIQGVYVYRENTIEEQSLGGDSYPATNFNNALEPITVTAVSVPANYQLVQYCYSFQGLPQTTDYPWVVITSGTAMIDNTRRTANITANTPSDYYQMLGFVGTRNLTNKYGQSFVNSLTLDPLGEDKATNYLYLQSPYAGGAAFHLNATIEVPGGLPATDISIYLNPYPIEGTAYGYGVGTGTNALNNDPSKTVFASNAPNFATSVFSNTAFPYTSAGTVVGTTSLSQCTNPAGFAPIANVAPAAGVQVYLFQYGFIAPNYTVNASFTLITDGSVNVDGIGNYYYNLAALFGTHNYTFAGVTYSTAVTTLMPVCSGPSVSNIDSVYCNDNRLFPLAYPYIDRLGLAYEFGTAQASDGSSTATTKYGGVYIYRHTVLEEAAPVAYPNFSDVPPQTISLTPVTGSSYTAVQWGYKMQCANNTLDYPCTVSVIGTAIVASTTPATATTGCQYYSCGVPYLTMVGFVGTRTFYGRYGQVLVQNISLAQVGEVYGDARLYLGAPFIDGDGISFYLNGTDGALTEFQGGLLGNEVDVSLNPYLTENIAISAGAANTLYYDSASAVVCSTAPGLTATAYSAATPFSPAGSASMSACAGAKFSQSRSANLTGTGLRSYALAYSVTDGKTYVSNVTATLYTDGTVNTDSLGNIFYNVISATGTRLYTYLPTGAATVQSITSVMAQNIVSTSNLAYITNNNRLYPSYPFFDRYGVAFTLNGTFAADGTAVTATTATSDILAVLVYRDNTLEEYTVFGGGNYPVTNSNNTLLPLTLTQVVPPPTYQLVQYCYVFYGLNNTIDYPWSSAVSGTMLIDNTTGLLVNSSSYSAVVNVPYYNVLGFVGTRNFTNKYGQSFVNTVTLNALGEDYDSNQLWLASPYAGGLSFHVNATIQTPGGLPATDVEVFLDPYPVEGTAYGYGVGGSTNALNNDPSRTVFVSNAPGFQTSTYSNVALTAINSNSVGTVAGTTDLTQCVAYFPTQKNTKPAAGVRVYNFAYTITNTKYYLVQGVYQLTTDGTVNVDKLGNYYFNVAAMSGTRTYTYFPTGVVSVANVTALMPVCSGPGVSNNDQVYCNDNRLYLSYPYVDRLGLAYEFSSTVSNAGAITGGTAYGGVYSYRETAVEEARSSQYPTWSDNVNQTISLTPVTGSTSTAVQWGYKMQCAVNTLDYPCTVSVNGTAIISSTTASVSTSGCGYVNCFSPYFQMVGFIGTRTFYNRYGQAYVQNISMAQIGEDYADQLLYLQAPYTDGNGQTFYLNGTDGALTQFPGGLFGNEINIYLDPYATETLAVSGGPSNALYYDPSATVFCSTAPGFQANTFSSAAPVNATGSTSMAACQGSKYSQKYNTNQTATGLRTYSFSYSTSAATWTATVNATLYTDGTVNYDQLGNIYYNVLSISGTRTYTYTSGSTSFTNVSTITSLMAQNIVPTSNRPDITNDNRLYPTYPYLDRYGLAFTLANNTAPDGSVAGTTDIVVVYVYRENTIEEYTLLGGAYPATNTANQMEPITLTQLTAPSSYKLVQWCYVLYGLNNTLDYPWSTVVSGTALIDTTAVLSTTATNGYSIGAISYYNMLGFLGTRTFTNRFGNKYVNALTLNAIGEDHSTNQLWLQSPYAGGVSFHLNATIQTEGGLPATDMEIFLDPYPVEGTAYGYGVGAGSNALNNDPSRTVFVSNAPGFQTSTYNNLALSTLNGSSVGSVYGTTDLTQCVASFPIQKAVAPAAGVRVYQFNYQIGGASGNFSTTVNLTLITDGSVNVDALGNYYYNVAAVSGTRTYTWFPTGNVTTYAITALAPICAGPSVSNIDSVYCNDNRLFPQYPYVDRLGIAYQTNPASPRPGAAPGVSLSAYQGVYVYREDVVEEANPVSGGYPTWSDNPVQYVSSTQMTGTAANYSSYQWGYVMQCANGSLDYPCAISVIATVIVQPLPIVVSATTVPGASCKYYLCGVSAYQVVGLIGTRTYVNRYGQRFVSNISLSANGEAYNDDLIYLAAPFSDNNGLSFKLNGTDGALTEMPGGVLGNEINVYLDPYPVETISTNGANTNALQTDPTRTVFCSTLPGFVPSAYSAANSTAAGSTVMSSCAPPVFSQKRTNIIGLTTVSLSYNVSDGKNFISLVSFTATTDGNIYTDPLGNQYWNASYIAGSHVYIDIATGSFNLSTISAVGLAGSYSSTGGQYNDNRIYPQAPYFDRRGLTLIVSPSTPTPGTTAQSSNASTGYFTVYNYREQVIEEAPARSYPVLAYQYIALVNGATPPLNLSAYGAGPTTSIPIITPPSTSTSSSTGVSGIVAPTVSSSSTAAAGGNTSNSGGGGSGSGLSGGDIAGIVIGSVVGALLLLGLCLFFVLSGTRKRSTKAESESSQVQNVSVIAPSEVSRTTGTQPLQAVPMQAVELQPVYTEAQEV